MRSMVARSLSGENSSTGEMFRSRPSMGGVGVVLTCWICCDVSVVPLEKEGMKKASYLVEAPEEHPEVVVREASDEGTRDGGRVVVPSQIAHGGCAVGLRVPFFFGLGSSESMAFCWMVFWCCADDAHGLDRFDWWSDGVIIILHRRQRHLFTGHWCSALHSGK